MWFKEHGLGKERDICGRQRHRAGGLEFGERENVEESIWGRTQVILRTRLVGLDNPQISEAGAASPSHGVPMTPPWFPGFSGFSLIKTPDGKRVSLNFEAHSVKTELKLRSGK